MGGWLRAARVATAFECSAAFYLAEAAYFLRDDGVDVDPLLRMLERAALLIDFDMSAHWPRMRVLMRRYERMDLADASVVVMSEVHARSQVLTLDAKDFGVYRRNDRQMIRFIAPNA
jgi:hypothetical protein